MRFRDSRPNDIAGYGDGPLQFPLGILGIGSGSGGQLGDGAAALDG